MTISPEDTTTELAAERTELAVTRTVLAAERSMMAWLRTSLSMYGLGFTIYKVLQAFHESERWPDLTTEAHRHVGLFLVGMGSIALVAGMIEFRVTIADLDRVEPVRLWRPSLALAVVMTALGLALLVGMTVGWL
ncbi:MAG: DUF202 domain-containing protein [Planctomycetota bacterium]